VCPRCCYCLGVQLVLPPMNLKPIGCLATLLLAVGKIEANEQPAPCVVYFSVLENDEVTVHRSVLKMNEPQSSWYEKYGNRNKYAGICYVENGAQAPADEPLYAIVWGEHLVSEPYTYSYEATARVNGDVNATITDQNGNTSTVSGTTSTSVPVNHSNSGTKEYDVADGWLAVWNPQTSEGKGSFVPIAALHNHNRTDLTSASTSLLKDAMEQISQREKERLASRGKWAVVTIRPLNNAQSGRSETSSSTPQSSLDTAQPTVPSAVQTTALKPSPAQSPVVNSTVSVSSTVPGADIFVDEDFVGNTPSTINVTAGKHIITIKKSGFQNWTRIVDFSGGSITLNAELAGGPNEMSTADPPTIPDRPKESATARVSTRSTQKPVGWIGVSTKDDSEEALVTNVTAQGPAALAGIHVGDVILTLDGLRIKGKEFQTVVGALKPGTRVPVSYARGSSTHEVWVTVASRD
jgi:PDZ domain-containing protein/PEGA domain-containing protein